MDHKDSGSNQRHKFLTEVGVLSNKVCCYPSATQHDTVYLVASFSNCPCRFPDHCISNDLARDAHGPCSGKELVVCRGSPVEMEAL